MGRLGVFVLVLCVACDAGGGASDAADAVTGDAGAPDALPCPDGWAPGGDVAMDGGEDGGAPGEDGGEPGRDGGTTPGAIVEQTDLGASWSCGAGCLDAWFTLADRYPEAAHPVPAEEVAAQVAALADAPPAESQGLAGQELRGALLEGLNLGFLLDAPDAPLTVTLIAEQEHDTYADRTLLFEGPATGTFPARLLVPHGPGPFPAVVGLHGHGDTPSKFLDKYMGHELADAGYVVLVPLLRAHDCSQTENDVARALLEDGFTLMGMRVWEALLMARYLKSRPFVAPDRLGLLGHSGGSSTANLVVRVTGCYAALVTDYLQDYRNTCGPDDIHCETIPAVAPLAPDVNDASTLPIPRLKVSYAFEGDEERQAIRDFFAEHLE